MPSIRGLETSVASRKYYRQYILTVYSILVVSNYASLSKLLANLFATVTYSIL
jgi:hypothetical protein